MKKIIAALVLAFMVFGAVSVSWGKPRRESATWEDRGGESATWERNSGGSRVRQ